MTNVYLSEATAHQAAMIQADHTGDTEGWCGFCLLHYRIRVRAGWCKPWQRAQEFINAYKRQRARLAQRPPEPQVQFPGQRVWPAMTPAPER